jgi:hypothetical protein
MKKTELTQATLWPPRSLNMILGVLGCVRINEERYTSQGIGASYNCWRCSNHNGFECVKIGNVPRWFQVPTQAVKAKV